MRLAATISRYLLGVIFVVFGLNGFLHFIPQPPMPPGLMKDFTDVMTASNYMVAVCAVQVIAGLLFLINRWVFMALLIIAPAIVNILIVHILLAPASIGPGAVVTILWLVVAYQRRTLFAPIFQAQN